MCARFIPNIAGAAASVLAGSLASAVLASSLFASPGETQIVFRCDTGKTHDVFRVMPDGSRLELVVHQERWLDEMFPSLSLDGQFMAMSCAYAPGECNLEYVDTSTGLVHELTPLFKVDTQVAWSPNGKVVAFASNRTRDFEIWNVRVDSRQILRTTSLAPRKQAHPSWAPDGEQIVFSSDSDLYIGNVDGSNIHPWLVGNQLGEPVWSPDGGRIAFTFAVDSVTPSDIHVRYIDGSAEWSLGRGKSPAWSPDGRSLAFVRFDAATAHDQLFTINTDGTGIARVTSDASDKSDPSWAIVPGLQANNYCATTPNSVGLGAVIDWAGNPKLSTRYFALVASGLPPGSHGIFFGGHAPSLTPFGEGMRCVAMPVARYGPIETASATGMVEHAFDHVPLLPSVIAPDPVFYFQYWYRDLRGTKLSDALRVEFAH